MKTFVPMLPEQIPQQRLNKVVTLPDKPKNFQVNVDYDVPLKKIDQQDLQENLYICVELNGLGLQLTTEWITTI